MEMDIGNVSDYMTVIWLGKTEPMGHLRGRDVVVDLRIKKGGSVVGF